MERVVSLRDSGGNNSDFTLRGPVDMNNLERQTFQFSIFNSHYNIFVTYTYLSIFASFIKTHIK